MPSTAELNRSSEQTPTRRTYRNMPSSRLQQLALERGEGLQLATGVIDVNTRPYTGRSPKDSFVVEGGPGVDYGNVNQVIGREQFDALYERAGNALEHAEMRFVQDRSVGADPAYNIPVTVTTESAAAAQFANTMFLPRREDQASDFERYSILHAPSLKLNGAADGVKPNSEVAVITDFDTRRMLIAGTGYLGEIKKRMFGVMQYELPKHDVATMHCSANMGQDGDVALFFGLSGTGKTTLSTTPERRLIGDDEHGWSDHGVFNFENGSYAKLIGLKPESEPTIYAASRRAGGISENGTFDLYLNPVYTEGEDNMRAAFPLSYMENVVPEGMGGHPNNILFLTADASGVLPPVAKLSPEEAIHWYLQGYTSKVAGTERGITEPQAEFSACFGAPFLPLPPEVYARLLAKKIDTYEPNVWLVNTGWPGGYGRNDRIGYGEKDRMAIAYTRDIVSAILSGEVTGGEADGLGLTVPTGIRGVPPEALRAENYWTDQEAYRDRARKLVADFNANAEKFAGKVPLDILGAGPHFSGTA